MAITAVTGTTWSNKGGTGTTAELRLLGGQISAAIASAGMVKTTDTGQIDWTTVNWITGVQTWGYEVWRFNDALQATKPVFLRLLYSQPSSPLMLTIAAQVGTATDGAGNLTSAPNTGVSVSGSNPICKSGASTVVATIGQFYAYGDGSSLIIAITPERISGSASSYGGLFFLERIRNLDGSPLGDAAVVTWLDGTITPVSTGVLSQVIFIHNLYAQPGGAFTGWFIPHIPATSGVVGTDMFTYPWMTGFSPRLGAPSTMVIGHYRTDMSVGNMFTCNHYGAPRTFVSIAPGPIAYPFEIAGTGNGTYPALRIS